MIDWQRAFYWLLLAALIFLALEQFADGLIEHAHAPMLDLAVYRSAVEGRPPVRGASGQMLFVYHPLVLDMLRLLGGQFVLKMLMVYAGLLLLYGATVREIPHWAFATFLGMSFSGIGVAAITTGNVTPFLQLAILGLAARGFDSRERRIAFLIAVAIATIVKPYMILTALIPLGVSAARRETLRPIVIEIAAMVGALIAVVGLYALVRPDATAAFIAALRTQTLTQGDLGIGVYGRLVHAIGEPAAMAAHLASIAAIAAIAIGSAWRQGRLTDPSFALLLFFLATIVNPRLQDYDLFPALVALILYVLSAGGWRATAALLPAFIAAAIPLHGARFVDIETGFWPYAPNVYAVAMALLVLALLSLPRLPQSPAARP